jgi:hypothetical protein
MIKSKLTTLAEEHSEQEFQRLSKDSLTWMKKKIEEIRAPNAISIAKDMSKESFRKTSTLKLGMMYCFYYDPKGKAEMPYYDRFPMIIVLEKYQDGFLGLNLHYLPYRYRVAFLKKLFQYAVLDKDDDIKRLRVTYDILTASKRFREFQPCIKRYLYGHVKSRVLTIQPKEWEVASLLPLQQFKKAKPTTVWQDSIQEIRKN